MTHLDHAADRRMEAESFAPVTTDDEAFDDWWHNTVMAIENMDPTMTALVKCGDGFIVACPEDITYKVAEQIGAAWQDRFPGVPLAVFNRAIFVP